MAGKRVPQQLKLFTILLVLAQIVTGFSNPCANIDFPTANKSVLTGKENRTVAIPFTITNHSAQCLENGYRLQLMKINPYSDHTVQCALPHLNNTCVQPKGKPLCVCPNTTGGDYHFHHTFRRTDNPPTLWKWSVDNGTGNPGEIIGERNITFDVVYPPSVVNLTISPSQPVEPGSDVNLTCSYDEGSPRVGAYLLNRNDTTLATSSYGGGQVQYRIDSAGCQDAGLIRCEAPGASHNQSATLLVKCRPKIQLFNSTKNETRTANLKLRVRAHTTAFQECTLNKSDTELNCSLTNLTGTPPDLVLTVRLDNVRKRDEGQWTLTLTNDAGSGSVDFNHHVPEENVTRNTDPTITHEDTQAPIVVENQTPLDLVTSVVTASAAVVVAAVVSVVVTVYRACKKRDDSKNRLPLGPWDIERLQSIFNSQSEMALSSRFAKSEECVMLPNFLYNGSRSLPDSSEGPYAEVGDHAAPKLMPDINNRPPAPLPNEVEDEEISEDGDYAEVDAEAERAHDLDHVTSEDEYVPISEILERKKQTQFEDVSDEADEGDDKKNVSIAAGSSLDLKMVRL